MGARGRPRGFDRDAALQRAMELFWRKGYENTSLSGLTAAMGINPPSLYSAFGSKEALFNEAVALYARTEGSGIWAPVAHAPSARAAIEHLLRASAEAFTRNEWPHGCMIVLAAPQSEGASPAVCEELQRRRREGVELLTRRIERAVEEGDVAPHVDCKALAAYFATVQHGMSILARDGASLETLLAVTECAMATWDALTS